MSSIIIYFSDNSSALIYRGAAAMDERIRFRVSTQTAETAANADFHIPPPPPTAADLAPAGHAAAPEPAGSSAAQEQPAGSSAAPDTEVAGVYIISVAARILDMHPQTLRKYERLGLINPGRTVGMLRLYSREDIRKVFLIRHLMENLGLNLAGVEFALNLVENLQGFQGYLQSAARGTPLEPAIAPAMAQLFRNLNLPRPAAD